MNFITPASLVIAFLATTALFPDLRAADNLPKSSGAYVVTGSMASPPANQAAAADEKFVYVVDDGVIAKHDRLTGKELARSVGKAQHLNSGFLWDGKLYCAHSNYPSPRKPHQSDIRVLDPATMKLDIFHTFDAPPGSPTWAVRRGKQARRRTSADVVSCY